jgi:tRNA pseudouridine55 synthase
MARDGLIVVDKPAGWTSHDVVARLRRVLGQRRVGHAGTLDPDATGVLLVGVGRATRLLRFLTPLRKEYTGEVVLGVETSTLDAGGEVVATHDMAGLELPEVQAAADRLVGSIDQVPPMVSAVKVGGRRLHELAREGIEVDRPARPVVVHRFDVTSGPADEPTVFRIRVECSSGTYVRVLAADVGRLLGGGAHLRNLRRVAVGSFRDDEALPLESVTPDSVLPPPSALRDYASVTVDADRADAIGHGKVLPAAVLGVEGDGPWAVLDDGGTLLAVYERHRTDSAKPVVVLTP